MWTQAYYQQVALFSLKPAAATSSGGKTLLCPTPYAIKMALLDAAIRTLGLAQAREFWPLLCNLRLQVRLPDRLTVLHTFTRIVRQRRGGAADATGAGLATPFARTIAYREYVQYGGPFTLALQPATGDQLPAAITGLLPQVNYFGKRGGFVQLEQIEDPVATLDATRFTALNAAQYDFVPGGMIQVLDDCAAQMTFEQADIYSHKSIKLGKERIIHHVVLPYQETRHSRGFSLYERIGA